MLRSSIHSGNSSPTHGENPMPTRSAMALAYPENASPLGITRVRSEMVATEIMNTAAILIA